MDDEIWFEEALLPPPELVEDTAKGLVDLEEKTLAAEFSMDAESLYRAA